EGVLAAISLSESTDGRRIMGRQTQTGLQRAFRIRKKIQKAFNPLLLTFCQSNTVAIHASPPIVGFASQELRCLLTLNGRSSNVHQLGFPVTNKSRTPQASE